MKRIVLIGYGTAGAVFHAPLIHACPNLELAAIVTSSPTRREQAIHHYPEVPLLDNSDAAFSEDFGFDAVVVATPHSSHVPIASRAIEAGLGVVVDKPLAIDGQQASQFADLVVTSGAVASVFQNRRWDGDFLTAAELIRDGSLGTVHVFESTFDRWRPQPRADSWRERNTAKEGGGVLMDLGPHLVDQAVSLFGPVESVYAQLNTRRADVQAEDDVLMLLQHDSGVQSRLSASATSAHPHPRFHISGSQGAYVKYGLDVQESQLRSGLLPSSPGWGEEETRRWGMLSNGVTEAPVQTSPGRWGTFYAQFAGALIDPQAGVPVPVTQLVHVSDILDAVKLSAVDRRAVPVTTSLRP